VKRLGEFERIERYFAPLAAPGAIGLTDDVAVVGIDAGRELVLKADTIVEGVHYLADDPPDLVARKLLRVNLSDLAGKGATPLGYLLTTTLPDRCDEAWLEAFARGLGEDQAAFSFPLLGGDTTRIEGPAVLSALALGTIARGTIVRRAGAKPGDLVGVTGTLGDGALGLMALRGELDFLDAGDRATLVRRYRLPEPRLAEGRALVGRVHAMLDVSDGLVQDLGHLAAASGVAATIELEKLPLSAAARRAVEARPALAAAVLGGGDDYELVFAAPPSPMPDGRVEPGRDEKAASETAPHFTVIGRIESGQGVRVVDRTGKEIEVAAPGYRHF
jgi:thiamine-monophosphate kinase